MPRPSPHPPSPLVSAGAPALSDYELVERVRAGDAVAFELIMRRHNRRLFRLARSILRNGAEAEDVVQETYVRAYAESRSVRWPAQSRGLARPDRRERGAGQGARLGAGGLARRVRGARKMALPARSRR